MQHDTRDDQASSLRNQLENRQEKAPLPPRSEIHQSIKKKIKWKLSFPFIRFILLLFIVIILLLLTIKFWGGEYLSSAETEKVNHEVEQVFVKFNQSTTSKISTVSTKNEITMHEVERMDTLFSISKEYYGTEDYVKAIIDANQIQNKTIIVGEKIIIPTITD